MSGAPTDRLAGLPGYLFAEIEWRAAAMRAAGADVISLEMGNPDGPTPAPIVTAGQAALADQRNHGYPTNRGSPEFRGAVAAYYARRFGVAVDPECEVLPAIGAKEAIFHLGATFLGPGARALIPNPGYQTYTTSTLLAGATPCHIPLMRERGFTLDLAAISESDSATARMLFLNYPNSPTGAAAPVGFFESVVEFARTHDVLVVHDNVYGEFNFDGRGPSSFLSTPGATDVAVEVISLSKSHNMAGWRCGAVVGNAGAIDAYRQMKATVDSGLFGVVQHAATVALDEELDSYIGANRATYERRRDFVCKSLSALGLDVTVPAGTPYVWVRTPAEFQSAHEYCSYVLERTGVVLSPGESYGSEGAHHFRLSLTATDERLADAIARLTKLVPWER